MPEHKIGTREEWMAARQELAKLEAELGEKNEEIKRKRLDLPWVPVEKEYVFDTEGGKKTLAELFDGRSQLLAYNIMFGPDYTLGACPGCTSLADGLDGGLVHLNHRDVTMIAVSRASFAKIEAYRKRMDWDFKWVSSADTDFSFDFHASSRAEDLKKGRVFYNFAERPETSSEREGVSVFYKDPSGRLFHTYSTYARGIDLMNTAYNYLDLTPKGRDENGRGQFWVRRHDEY